MFCECISVCRCWHLSVYVCAYACPYKCVHIVRAVGKLFRITLNTCVEVSPNRKELNLSFIQCPLFWSATVDNFDLNTSRCARLGVNYFFTCTKNTLALAGFGNCMWTRFIHPTTYPIMLSALQVSRLSNPFQSRQLLRTARPRTLTTALMRPAWQFLTALAVLTHPHPPSVASMFYVSQWHRFLLTFYRSFNISFLHSECRPPCLRVKLFTCLLQLMPCGTLMPLVSISSSCSFNFYFLCWY